ncbi:MAG: hypothetical protein VB140_06595 [Burkholderia sp.]
MPEIMPVDAIASSHSIYATTPNNAQQRPTTPQIPQNSMLHRNSCVKFVVFRYTAPRFNLFGWILHPLGRSFLHLTFEV